MNIAELIALQRAFDDRHGWTPNAHEPDRVLEAIMGDIVGMASEFGELADIVHKMRLEQGAGEDVRQLLDSQRPLMARELVDVFVYLMRIASHLHIDVEATYRSKLAENEVRFQRFEVK